MQAPQTFLHAVLLDFHFSKFQIFNRRQGQEGHRASRCQILWRSVKPLLRYGNFSLFQDGGRRHLGFLKFLNFNGRKGKEVQTA